MSSSLANKHVLHTILGKELAEPPVAKYHIPSSATYGLPRAYPISLRCSGRKQNLLLRDAITHGKHSLEHGTGSIAANATHFTGRSHIHSQYRVGFLEAVERELARLDPDIIEFEQIFLRLSSTGRPSMTFVASSIKLIFNTLLTKGKRTAGARRLHSITFISLSLARY